VPVLLDIPLCRLEDGTFKIEMTPPVSISGWAVQWLQQKRFGGISGLILSMASGFVNGQSGLTLTDGAAGKFQAQEQSVYTSGQDYGNYAVKVERMDSGSRTALTTGYLTLFP
jgi:hypothetical protein